MPKEGMLNEKQWGEEHDEEKGTSMMDHGGRWRMGIGCWVLTTNLLQ